MSPHRFIYTVGILLILVTVSPSPGKAQESTMHAGALAHALDRVRHTGRVLYVAAHPDDENTRLLAYLANSRNLTVGYLSLTRGEGGQNLIGSEQGELLGVIRTQELLAARRIDGAVQRFTRMRDFGYSKNPEETLAQWNKEEALADVVWVIRTFQPDVVITRFDEQPPNHGHHTASAVLAREAFAATADSARFPEQLREGVGTWQVDRLLHNVSPWRGKPPADALALDVGGYDARLGLSYGELAARSRTQHKSQGFGASGERGVLLEHFVHVAGQKPGKELFSGLDFSWKRFGAPAVPFTQALSAAASALDRDSPERAIPALVKAYRLLEALPEVRRTMDTRVALERVIAAALGLYVRATADAPAIAPGGSLATKLELVLRRPATVRLERVRFPDGHEEALQSLLAVHERRELSHPVAISPDAPVSTPYWLRTPSSGARHEVRELGLIGEAEGPPALVVEVELSIDGSRFVIPAPVVHTWTDPVHGERTRAVQITPPATVTPTRESVMVTNGAPGRVSLRIRGWQAALEGAVRLPVPAGWQVTPAVQAVSLEKIGDEALIHFEVKAPPGAKGIQVTPEFISAGNAWSFREDIVDHPHIPLQRVLQPVVVRLVPLSVRLPKGLVGYVEGSGDTVFEDLAHIGVRLEQLDDQSLRSGALGRYSAIVLGIRAFNTREILRTVHPRLLRYVEDGGTLVVQYNTHNRWSPLTTSIGPFPLTLGRERVTDERAPMVPIDPGHPVLQKPNRLGPADFDLWVQERGLYFAEKWDERYVPIFRIADPGEAPLLGSTLVARHGKGRFVYSGLSFFRQLPAGVPGAFRLLINLMEAR